jgi:short-subunit dehydrogenase
MALFSNQTILITGASGGIGEAIAHALSREDATVCLSGRNEERLNQVAARISPKKVRCYPADLTVDEQLQAAINKMLAENQRIDALIHCAAIIVIEPVATASAQDFERQFKANVLAPFRLTQLLLPSLIEAEGQILFVNSSAGMNARPNVSQYAATKHALRALADSLRGECNASGVRVCSLFLGDTATPMQAAVRAQQKRPYDPKRIIQPEDVAAMTMAVLSLPRTAEVTDVMIRPMAKT